MKRRKVNESEDHLDSIVIPEKKKNNSVKWIIALIIIFLMVGGIGVGIWFAHRQSGPDYQEVLAAGLRCYNKQDYEQAEDYYLQAIDIFSKEAEPYQMLYQIYTVTEQPEKAESIRSEAAASLDTETWDVFEKQTVAFDIDQMSGDLEEDDLNLVLGDDYSIEDLAFVLAVCNDFDSSSALTPEMLKDIIGRMLISLNFDLEDNPLSGDYESKTPSFGENYLGRPVDLVNFLLNLFTDYTCADLPEDEKYLVACEDGYVFAANDLEVNASIVSIDHIYKEGDTITVEYTQSSWPNNGDGSTEPQIVSRKKAVLVRQSDGSVRFANVTTLSSQAMETEQQTEEEEETSTSLDTSYPQNYPDDNPSWVIFTEGYRDGRVEMTTCSASGNDIYAEWNKALNLPSAFGDASFNQYYLDEETGDWIFMQTYSRFTDYAISILDTNIDIKDEAGNLIMSKTQTSND